MIQFYLSTLGNLFLKNNLTSTTTSPNVLLFHTYQKQGLGATLIALNRMKPNKNDTPEIRFFRNLSSLYLNELCHTPKESQSVEPIDLPKNILKLKSSFPLMPGSEYLNDTTIPSIWDQMNQHLLQEVQTGSDLEKFLAKIGSRHHQVGRVCFHLAENKDQQEKYPFAFLATYAAALTKNGKLKYLPLSEALKEYAGAKNRNALINLLGPIHKASNHSPLIKDLLESNEIYHPYPLTSKEAFQFLNDVESYEHSGLQVKIPNWWKTRPYASVLASANIENKTSGLLSAKDLVKFDFCVAIGNQKVSQKELKELLKGERGLRFVKGQWVEVDPEKIKKLLEKLKNDESYQNLTIIDAMKKIAGMDKSNIDNKKSDIIEYQYHGKLKEIITNLLDPSTIKSSTIPKSLNAQLRPYQKSGYDWLNLTSHMGLGSCLADDMGLGKTIQIIAYLLKQLELSPKNQHLLIVPASLLGNWQSELQKFAPSINYFLYHSSFTNKAEIDKVAKNPSKILQKFNVVITTYALLKSAKWIKNYEWQNVIIDEAQAIKNPHTKQTKEVKAIKAKTKIALTGTPIENKLMDLWSLFDFINPGLLGNQTQFKSVCHSMINTSKQLEPLKLFINPYILRRLKTDKKIIKDLPDKTELKTYCYLTKRQGAAYQACVKKLAYDLDSAIGIKKRGIVLSYLTQLKQICNHPSLQKGDEIYQEDSSGKLKRLKELCEEISAKQEKVLIFSQYKEILPQLSDFLSEIFCSKGYILHGGTSAKKRKEMVAAFQKEDGFPFFLLSLKAGGTGLNLTSANHVIHFDRWWNPAVENQATDRAFRIGQKKNVLVHKFISKGTLEEKIDLLIEEKKGLSDSILTSGAENIITELDNDEIIKLVSLNINEVAI